MEKQIIVVDTSVVVKWLNGENERYLEQADILLESARKKLHTIIAPELIKYEVGNVLLKGKRLTQQQAAKAIEVFYRLPIRMIQETESLAKETISIAVITGSTYYDAAFMALAKEYNAPLITDNPKHQKSVNGITVIPLSEFK